MDRHDNKGSHDDTKEAPNGVSSAEKMKPLTVMLGAATGLTAAAMVTSVSVDE